MVCCPPHRTAGESYVNIEYECGAPFDLQNVHIYIPLPASAQTPQVNQVWRAACGCRIFTMHGGALWPGRGWVVMATRQQSPARLPKPGLLPSLPLATPLASLPCCSLTIPPTRLTQIDGDWRYDMRKSCLVWSVELIDDTNRSGSAEFVVPAAPADAFFPIEVRPPPSRGARGCRHVTACLQGHPGRPPALPACRGCPVPPGWALKRAAAVERASLSCRFLTGHAPAPCAGGVHSRAHHLRRAGGGGDGRAERRRRQVRQPDVVVHGRVPRGVTGMAQRGSGCPCVCPPSRTPAARRHVGTAFGGAWALA